jgi:hypothetical protein
MIPVEFAAALRVGSSVEVRWTNCNRHYRANAVVVAISGKTGRARITHAVPTDHGGYPAGQAIKAPLPFKPGHTAGNGFYPITKSDEEQVAAAAKTVQIREKFNELVGKAIEGIEIKASKPISILDMMKG